MSYLFDTNIIIGFLKNEEKIVKKIQNENQLNISVITVGEMLFGARNSELFEKNINIYKDFFKQCNIFCITEKTSAIYSEIRYRLKKIGKPIPENDIWIASVSEENNLTLVTRDKHLIDIDFIKKEIW